MQRPQQPVPPRTGRPDTVGAIRYQPIVALEGSGLGWASGWAGAPQVVAAEALTSPPLHLAPEETTQTSRSGVVAQDLARLRAIVADVTSSSTWGTGEAPCVFVNIEPCSLALMTSAVVHEIFVPLLREATVIVEVTERRMLDDPAGLLRGIRLLREVGCGVAVDDVGSTPAALALLPLIEPDVIKLDMGLLHGPVNRATAATVAGVRAQGDRSGALVLAEGIETPEHQRLAVQMGADLGQGWLYGGSSDRLPRSAAQALMPSRPLNRHHLSPFAVLSRSNVVRPGSQHLLTQMSRHLEDQALGNADGAVVLAALTGAHAFHGLTARRFRELGQTATFTAVAALGMERTPCPGVLGQPLTARSPLAGEWVMTVVTPFFAGMLAARPLQSVCERPGPEEVYRYAVSYERTLVVEAARCLVRELEPATPDGRTAAGGVLRAAAGSEVSLVVEA